MPLIVTINNSGDNDELSRAPHKWNSDTMWPLAMMIAQSHLLDDRWPLPIQWGYRGEEEEEEEDDDEEEEEEDDDDDDDNDEEDEEEETSQDDKPPTRRLKGNKPSCGKD